MIAASRRRYKIVSIERAASFDGVPEVVEDLSRDGVPMAVATSKPHAYAAPILDALGLTDRFVHVAGPTHDGLEHSKRLMIAEALGALDTRAASPSGLDGPGMATSAYDLALIFRDAMADPVFADLVSHEPIEFPGYPMTADEIDYANALAGEQPVAVEARWVGREDVVMVP